jgi:hypothetical protein
MRRRSQVANMKRSARRKVRAAKEKAADLATHQPPQVTNVTGYKHLAVAMNVGEEGRSQTVSSHQTINIRQSAGSGSDQPSPSIQTEHHNPRDL